LICSQPKRKVGALNNSRQCCETYSSKWLFAIVDIFSILHFFLKKADVFWTGFTKETQLFLQRARKISKI
jgi:hypothetical protein